MSKASPTGRSRLSLPDLDLIANQTRLVIRKSRKFTPGGFLQTLLSSVVTGHASFNQLVGDLVLRDMGYFSLGEFSAIEERGAWWLTRLPLTTGVMLENGGSLEKHLKNFPADTIDLDVIAGEQGKKCRLVAMRAAPEVTRARRAARRKKARE